MPPLNICCPGRPLNPPPVDKLLNYGIHHKHVRRRQDLYVRLNRGNNAIDLPLAGADVIRNLRPVTRLTVNCRGRFSECHKAPRTDFNRPEPNESHFRLPVSTRRPSNNYRTYTQVPHTKHTPSPIDLQLLCVSRKTLNMKHV